MCKHTVVRELEAELKKHPGLAAVVNTETGEVSAVFMSPKPYWETARNDAGDTGKLTADEIKVLETEKQSLIDSLPRLNRGQRSKATTRIAVIESELRRGRSNEESARVNRERETERQRERFGTPAASANTQRVVNWSALDMATQTDLIQATMKELRRAGAAK